MMTTTNNSRIEAPTGRNTIKITWGVGGAFRGYVVARQVLMSIGSYLVRDSFSGELTWLAGSDFKAASRRDAKNLRAFRAQS